MDRLYVDLQWTEKGNQYVITDTNIKREMIDELLSEWVRMQIGKGADERKAEKRKAYNIRIEIDLQGDVFYTKSDTGNAGLTTGIVATGIGRWSFSPALEARVKEAELKSLPAHPRAEG